LLCRKNCTSKTGGNLRISKTLPYCNGSAGYSKVAIVAMSGAKAEAYDDTPISRKPKRPIHGLYSRRHQIHGIQQTPHEYGIRPHPQVRSRICRSHVPLAKKWRTIIISSVDTPSVTSQLQYTHFHFHGSISHNLITIPRPEEMNHINHPHSPTTNPVVIVSYTILVSLRKHIKTIHHNPQRHSHTVSIAYYHQQSLKTLW